MREASDPEERSVALAGRYARGTGRDVVADLLRRTAADADVGHGAQLLGARSYWVESRGPRWIVAGTDGEHAFDSGEAARAFAGGRDVEHVPGSAERARCYTLDLPFLEPLAIGAHLIAARGAGDCLGWNGVQKGRRPCQSKAVSNYRPYCGLHGGWDFRHKRGGWEVERERAVRMLVKLAASDLAEDVMPLTERRSGHSTPAARNVTPA